MTEAQSRAVQNYRARLLQRGLARFEVQGLGSDRELIRRLARQLAQGDAQANELRSAIHQSMAKDEAAVGGVLNALRRSPLVGADLNFTRDKDLGRKVDL